MQCLGVVGHQEERLINYEPWYHSTLWPQQRVRCTKPYRANIKHRRWHSLAERPAADVAHKT